MKIREIAQLIEQIAPPVYQESYDNCGLITGSFDTEVKAILLALDTTEEVIDEAIAKGCNLIVAHHPIIFKGLKKLNGKNYVERAIIKAIKNDIAIYAAHTNLDNVLQHGVNQKFAKKLGINNLSILMPKDDLLAKFFVYVPESHIDIIKNAMFEAGAGKIAEYSECSFTVEGIGTFKPSDNAHPFEGEANKRSEVTEKKIEVILPIHLINDVIKAAKHAHPYEEMAYEVVALKNTHQEVGSGVVGEFEKAMSYSDFLKLLKNSFNLEVVKHSKWEKDIKRVAVCGGVGSFLIQQAASAKVDAYVTSDVKYHEFFDVENRYMLCDIGHFESEISTLDIFYEIITEKFPNFAVIFCSITTNPIQYYK